MGEKQDLGPNQQKWLAALRSGEYVQGTEYLRTTSDRFCCLGVACELAGIEKSKREGTWDYRSSCCWQSQEAPDSLVEWLGLYGSCGEERDALSEMGLAGLNDNGKTFAEIADIIESDPAQYFTEPR